MPSSHRRKIDFLRSVWYVYVGRGYVWYVSLCRYTLTALRRSIHNHRRRHENTSVNLAKTTRVSHSQKSALCGLNVLESTSTKKVKYSFTALQLYSFTALQLYTPFSCTTVFLR